MQKTNTRSLYTENIYIYMYACIWHMHMHIHIIDAYMYIHTYVDMRCATVNIQNILKDTDSETRPVIWGILKRLLEALSMSLL